MYYSPSGLWHFPLQIRNFIYNFYSGVNFCGENICGNFILWETAKIAKIRTRKNLVPHGTFHPRVSQGLETSISWEITK